MKDPESVVFGQSKPRGRFVQPRPSRLDYAELAIDKLRAEIARLEREVRKLREHLEQPAPATGRRIVVRPAP